jgi:16S rRNA processing protein RimM
VNEKAVNETPPAGSLDSHGALRGPGVVAVGRIGKAHGIRGAVYVEPWTDAPEERFLPGAVLDTEPVGRGPLTVAEVRSHSGKQVVQFIGIDDRNTAEAIRGTVLVMAASARPLLDDPDEFYDTDLIGLAVRQLDGTAVGSVTDVLHSPADSLLAIDVEGREVLVPFRKQFVPVVDLSAGTLTIDPPDGLLDL